LLFRKFGGKSVMVPRNFEVSEDLEPQPTSHTEEAPPVPGERVRETLDELFTVAYEELRRIAASLKRGDRNLTLNPTALVNETWLKLARARGLRIESRLHLKRVAAHAIRYILADAARRRPNSNHGDNEEPVFVTFSDFAKPMKCDKQFLALHEALDELERVDSRQATMVECRYFGGFDVAELVEFLQVSEATITRDWKAAKAWLAAEIRERH
jgi:RNA polymerase sigma factor (TIGR02999 family)